MTRSTKLAIGWTLWTVGSLAFATLTHYAPEGAYDDLGSSLESVFFMMWMSYFIGIPILTGLWIKEGEDT